MASLAQPPAAPPSDWPCSAQSTRCKGSPDCLHLLECCSRNFWKHSCYGLGLRTRWTQGQNQVDPGLEPGGPSAEPGGPGQNQAVPGGFLLMHWNAMAKAGTWHIQQAPCCPSTGQYLSQTEELGDPEAQRAALKGGLALV